MKFFLKNEKGGNESEGKMFVIINTGIDYGLWFLVNFNNYYVVSFFFL